MLWHCMKYPPKPIHFDWAGGQPANWLSPRLVHLHRNLSHANSMEVSKCLDLALRNQHLTYFTFLRFRSVLCLSFERKKKEKLKYGPLWQRTFIQVIRNFKIVIGFHSNLHPSRKLSCKKSHFLADNEVEYSSIRSVLPRNMTSPLIPKEIKMI